MKTYNILYEPELTETQCDQVVLNIVQMLNIGLLYIYYYSNNFFKQRCNKELVKPRCFLNLKKKFCHFPLAKEQPIALGEVDTANHFLLYTAQIGSLVYPNELQRLAFLTSLWTI